MLAADEVLPTGAYPDAHDIDFRTVKGSILVELAA